MALVLQSGARRRWAGADERAVPTTALNPFTSWRKAAIRSQVCVLSHLANCLWNAHIRPDTVYIAAFAGAGYWSNMR